jgi:hypothetical protein
MIRRNMRLQRAQPGDLSPAWERLHFGAGGRGHGSSSGTKRATVGLLALVAWQHQRLKTLHPK